MSGTRRGNLEALPQSPEPKVQTKSGFFRVCQCVPDGEPEADGRQRVVFTTPVDARRFPAVSETLPHLRSVQKQWPMHRFSVQEVYADGTMDKQPREWGE